MTDYAADVLAESGWEVSQTAFDYIDWPPQGDVVDPDVVGGQGLRLVTAACGKGDIGEPEATTVTSTMPPATSTDKHPPVPA